MDFASVSRYLEELEATTGRKALVAILARMFGEAGPELVRPVAYLCQGRLAPFFNPLEIGLGERLVAESIALAFGVDRQAVNRRYGVVGDLGLVAEELAKESRTQVDAIPPSVLGVFGRLREIATTSGSGSLERKLGQFSSLLADCDPSSAKHVARIPLGRLRLGIGDATMLDAFSMATVGDTSLRKRLERAYNETSDLGLIAETLWSGGVEAVDRLEITVGSPIRPALAERLPSAEAIVAKLGLAAVEPKLDGFRCQVHKSGDTVSVFSRNLENMTDMFPELVEASRANVLADSAVFEGEAVAYNAESEEYLPFQETTRRRRKHNVAEMAGTLPLRLFAFDLIYVDGENWAGRPYTERRSELQRRIATNDTLLTTPVIMTSDADVLHQYLLDSIQKGLEGVVAKKPDSTYQAGARNFNWVKLKRAQARHLQDTVDCVILGYIYGRGKRAAFGVGALLVGVYDAERDEFRSVTKIGTGLTDEEWREIRVRCDRLTLDQKPARVVSTLTPSVWVEPSVVIEVLADEITRSPVHTAGAAGSEPGYALRFPRLVSFRSDDRRAEDATTVTEVIEMYDQQASLRSRGSEEDA
jgi:DNA ligase 1